jgi:GMP synthase (glutamine-hydrolysing)
MAPRILALVDSRASDPGEVGRVLEASGRTLERRIPRLGQRLPKTLEPYEAVIMFGGPRSANGVDHFAYMRRIADFIEEVLRAEKPFLGICLGAQVMARVLGARVTCHEEGVYEVGYFSVQPTPAGAALIDPGLHVYHWHHEGFELPAGAVLLARGEAFPNQAYRYGRAAFGLQFHPEVTSAMRRRWVVSGASELKRPGAQSAAEQEARGARYEAAMHRWLARFLMRWLGEAAGWRPEPRECNQPDTARRASAMKLS